MPHFNTKQQSSIAHTGFMVGLVSYILFWMLDLVRPGFVARFFSVHIFLLSAIIFGVWWGSVVEEYSDRPRVQHTLMFVCGILCAVLTWNLATAFGSWRVIVSLIALATPMLVLRLVKYK